VAKPNREYSLGRLRSDEARPVSRKPGLTPIGINRELPADHLHSGEWTSAENTSIWRIAVRSEGADSIRVRFKNFHVGAGRVTLLATEKQGAEITAGPYTGDGPFGDGEFWSDLLAAESVIIAYEPADGSATSTLPFAIDKVAHRFVPATFVTPKAAGSAPKAAAASCTVDVSCHGQFAEPASAVALIAFESEGESYQCSGALISSASQPLLPFFLTANHCVANADEAKSVIAFFNYQTAACNGEKPTLSRSPRVTGSTFVSGGALALGDYTLLRLSAFPNIDVKVLGWNSTEIAANQQVTSISHPHGDYKRIALGERTRDATIRFDDGTRMPANRGYQVSWFEGVTQGGSSGSPLLANIGGRQYVVGTLTGGPDIDEDDDALVCRTSNMIGSYGRFTAAYPDLQRFLTSIDGGASITPSSATASLTATALSPTTPAGVVSLTWQAPGYSRVQIRVGSPTGTAMTGIEGPNGVAQTGPWATEGMTFYLQDASDGDSFGPAKTIATVRVLATGAATQRSGEIGISPGLIILSRGQSAGAASIAWTARGVSRVQIRIGSPTGTPMTGLENSEGFATTGPWVTDGLTFFLQDASDGDSSGSSKTLAWVRAQVWVR
jgi:V8-like Glu-specific endopeptidase